MKVHPVRTTILIPVVLVLLLSAACKKKEIGEDVPPASNTVNIGSSPAQSQTVVDTFVGEFKMYAVDQKEAKLYVQHTRGSIIVTGSMVLNYWGGEKTHVVHYEKKISPGNGYQVSYYRTTYDEWWVGMVFRNDSAIVDWYHSEELLAKGPNGGWHTSKEASYAGKKKRQ